MKEISLNGTWQVAGIADGTGDPSKLIFQDGPVPGMVQQMLLSRGTMPDPYKDRNAEHWRGVAEQEWWYRRTFADPAFDGPVELHFAGLDTFAEIYLNGEQVATHANMFRPLTLNVTGHLRPENELLVRLRSPLGRDFSRKAPLSYGWGFAPPLVTTGIWKDVSLRLLPPVVLRDLRVETVTSGELAANLVTELELEATDDRQETVQVRFRLWDDGIEQRWSATVPAHGLTRLTRSLDGIQYWWPNGQGEPHLYKLEAEVWPSSSAPEPFDRRELQIGFRTVERQTRDDDGRASYLLRMNGRPVFAKGAVWVPLNPWLTPDEDWYRELLTMARDANVNLLRVWGGGIYEHDCFYRLCDELGLMVWQDFLFADSCYPTQESFLAEAGAEAAAAVRRLRSHPSLVIWAAGTGGSPPLNQQVLPDAVAKLDPAALYDAGNNGARENWTVWGPERLPVSAYVRDETPFVKAFGMQAVPHLESLRNALSEENLWPLNDIWEYHSLESDRLNDYMRPFGVPQTVSELIGLSQRTQAAADSFAIRHYRSRAPRCGGLLVWQWNDTWPCVSWSLVDFSRRPKLGYWEARRALAPVMTLVRTDAGETAAFLVNDDPSQDGRQGLFRVEIVTFDGDVLWTHSQSCVLPPAPGRAELFRGPLPVVSLLWQRRCAVRAEFVIPPPRVRGGAVPVQVPGHPGPAEHPPLPIPTTETVLASHHCFLADERDLELTPLILDAAARRLPGGEAELTLKGGAFVHLVWIAGGMPTENGFDLWPDRTVTIRVRAAGSVLFVTHAAGPGQAVVVAESGGASR